MGGEELQPFWVEGGARLDGEVEVGDTAHAQLSSAHTHTDLRQENGSSLNWIDLAMNTFCPKFRMPISSLGWSRRARGLEV